MLDALHQALADKGFSRPVAVQGRSSIADLFRVRARRGVYVLVFENGDLYVGKATDVTRRYVQHLRDRPDIAMIAFKRVRKDQLDQTERDLINDYQLRGLPLRNIALTNMPWGESDLDLVITHAEQDAWLAGEHAFQLRVDDRPDLTALAAKTEARMARFMAAKPPEALAAFLRAYAKEVLPDPARTELSFWCVTLLASCVDRQWGIIARVNVGWQEILTLLWDNGKLRVKLQAARSMIEGADGQRLEHLLASYPWLETEDSSYVAGGADQVALYAPIQRAERLLRDPTVGPALRLQMLRLMRKGRCIYSRAHCPQMANLMFGAR